MGGRQTTTIPSKQFLRIVDLSAVTSYLEFVLFKVLFEFGRAGKDEPTAHLCYLFGQPLLLWRLEDARQIYPDVRTVKPQIERRKAAWPSEGGAEEHEVSAVVNGPEAKEISGRASIPLAELAAVGWVAGSLLLEGREAGVPVVALLIKTHKGIQDYESGLKLAEAIMKMVPSAYCDLAAIRREAERTEKSIRRVWRQTSPTGVYGLAEAD